MILCECGGDDDDGCLGIVHMYVFMCCAVLCFVVGTQMWGRKDGNALPKEFKPSLL